MQIDKAEGRERGTRHWRQSERALQHFAQSFQDGGHVVPVRPDVVHALLTEAGRLPDEHRRAAQPVVQGIRPENLALQRIQVGEAQRFG